MPTGLRLIQNSIKDYHDSLLNKRAALQGFLDRNVFAIYKQAQITRWETEGASEGFHWKPISEAWVKRKMRYKRENSSEFPGGSKLMVFRGILARAAAFDGDKFTYRSGGRMESVTPKKIATDSRLEITISGPYPKYVDEERPFMKFGDETRQKMIKAIRSFMVDRGIA